MHALDTVYLHVAMNVQYVRGRQIIVKINAWVFICTIYFKFQWSLHLCHTSLVWMTLQILKSLRKNGINPLLMTSTQAKSSQEKNCRLLGSLTLGHKTGNVVYIGLFYCITVYQFKKSFKRREWKSQVNAWVKKNDALHLLLHVFDFIFFKWRGQGFWIITRKWHIVWGVDRVSQCWGEINSEN